MFDPLPAKFDFPAAEKKVLEFWQKHDIFAASLRNRAGAPRFVFYEGPPTANGLPHPGHCLTRAIKDIFPRYQTMCGKLVERKAGWDTHGLPVEVEVCKELGIHTKEEIEAYGVEKFVKKCIESVFRYTREWEEMTRRLGFWVNLEEAYVTYHQSYVESVWWSLKTLFERGLLYQGHKVVWWWPQAGTALSSGEVGEGYRTVDDPSVFVRFPILEEGSGIRDHGTEGSAGILPARSEREAQASGQRLDADEREELLDSNAGGVVAGPKRLDAPPMEGHPTRTSLLVWTTTPWTLISNHFAAVNPDLEYALVYDATTNERLYVAADLVETLAKKVKHDLQVLARMPGGRLVGLRYQPPFAGYYDHVHGEMEVYFGLGLAIELLFGKQKDRTRLGELQADLKDGGRDFIGWRVLAADFVTLDAGTGVVHEAPAFGEVDFNLLQKERQRFADPNQVPLLCAVAPNGTFTPDAGEKYAGRNVKEADKDIIRELKERGLLYHQEQIRHEYPFAPRAENDALIQYARRSWFVRTSQFRDEFLKNNAQINWLPEHIKEGRFGDFLRNNVDWALSRERFWGTPLPIWVCEKTGRMEAIGSFAELKAKPGATDGGYWTEHKTAQPGLSDHLQVHKPYIDAWTYDSSFSSGSRMRRVPEVIDCWWDAGSMPFAQWGFPHQPGSIEVFGQRFPADFISEALDQTRGWFYGLLAISTLLGSAGILPARQRAQTSMAASESAGIVPARDYARRGVLNEPISASFTTRRRHKLPHWEAGGSTYFLTFRVAKGELSPSERRLVLDASRHWDGKRMLLHAAVVMPDHVHLLCTPTEKSSGEWWSIADLMHSIKSHAAREINRARGSSGSFWQAEYFDRIIRGESDFSEKLNYIIENPMRRELGETYEWIWVEPDHANDASSPDPCGQDARTTQNDASSPVPCGQDARTPQLTRVPEYPHPYRTCIVLGLILGEDGNKMSKRLRNYKEPSYIFDSYGADAMRWYFFSAQAPWTSTRFTEANIRDSQKDFLVKLYNVLSFFNIYANIDGFLPIPDAAHGKRPTAERSELDRWIISELHRTIRFVREKMDRFENFPAAQRLNDFVDSLSNWYVRRSRDRFWRQVSGNVGTRERGNGAEAGSADTFPPSHIPTFSPADQDKWDAYHTLYGCLYTLAHLIAPFTPFFAETMYQSLMSGGGTCRGEPGTEGRGDTGTKASDTSSLRPSVPSSLSVHLCDYPVADESLIDETLAAEMDLVREIVSAGRAARTAAKLRVRQPLAQVEIILARAEHRDWLESHEALIAEELNVKRVEFAPAAERYVTYKVVPNFKAIGAKYRALVPGIKSALTGIADPAAALRSLSADGALPLVVDGQEVRLTGEEVEIRLEAKPGWSAAQSRAGVAVLSTEITPELRDEGVIRELIHHVQALRKDRNLPYQARIVLHVDGPAEFLELLRRFEALVREECLVQRIEFARPAQGHSVEIEGFAVMIDIAPLAL